MLCLSKAQIENWCFAETLYRFLYHSFRFIVHVLVVFFVCLDGSTGQVTKVLNSDGPPSVNLCLGNDTGV